MLLFGIAIAILGSNLVAGAQFAWPDPSNGQCIGVLLNYQVASVTKIFPILPSNSSLQPYRFQSTISLANTGFKDVKDWQVLIAFRQNEWLAKAEGAVLANGQQLPARVGNGVILYGFPDSDLKNAIQTAGDYAKIQTSVNLIGTEFGIGPPRFPLPANISLVNDGWECNHPQIHAENQMHVCCPEVVTNGEGLDSTEEILPLETGDVIISYDVMQTFQNFYQAQVTISNKSPVGRLDNWRLSWEWKQGEFIHSMNGAQTTEQHQTECINGPPGFHYPDLDFSQAMNCQRIPVIMDLAREKSNESGVQFCCRNGTILPEFMGSSLSKSCFEMNVYKIPPHLEREKLSPPSSFSIGSRYTCGHPRLVSPSKFPDPFNRFRSKSAVKSWQISCNASRVNFLSKCCVSFSAFFNTSVVPCPTCACGCPAQISGCDKKAKALLLPPGALLIPAPNRTPKAVAWAVLNDLQIPNPKPCADYCGVSINWHIHSDYEDGWSARISVLNWEKEAVKDWFAVVELGDDAFHGYQTTYSFNGSSIFRPDLRSSLFLQGTTGMNYLLGPQAGEFAGKIQSMISFRKKRPVDLAANGAGFPSRIVFNGEECSLPHAFPTSSAGIARAMFPLHLLLLLMLRFLLFQL